MLGNCDKGFCFYAFRRLYAHRSLRPLFVHNAVIRRFGAVARTPSIKGRSHVLSLSFYRYYLSLSHLLMPEGILILYELLCVVRVWKGNNLQ